MFRRPAFVSEPAELSTALRANPEQKEMAGGAARYSQAVPPANTTEDRQDLFGDASRDPAGWLVAQLVKTPAPKREMCHGRNVGFQRVFRQHRARWLLHFAKSEGKQCNVPTKIFYELCFLGHE